MSVTRKQCWTSLAAALITSLAATYANAAVVLDLPTVSGPADVIDPAGSETVDDSFGTAQATLEARSNLRVLQSFTGFTNGDNIVSFTDSDFPDIQFDFSGSIGTNAGVAYTANAVFATSGIASMLINNTTGSNVTTTLTIRFGTWDGTNFTANRTVDAAAFALTHAINSKTGSVTFRDALGAAITGASFNYTGVTDFDDANPNLDGNQAGNHKDFYFGWDSDSQTTSAIGSIVITHTTTTSGTSSIGFDDLAFTIVPEPGSLALLALGGLLVGSRRRRD